MYLDEAYEISPQLLGKAFYAAVVLKVRRLKVKFDVIFTFCVCVQNAEMQFNFGDQPFKFPPEEGYDYTALAKAKGLIDGEGTYVL